ncbi:hypothetical protein [Streptomyces sp. NPDC056061]|uniref:hypothetical protein n=1 Tax=Streptomyces sp. NPDC056061 TaxID=3345700 RepID=UPI0035D7FAF0
MTTRRFDSDPDEPYGRCLQCPSLVLTTQADATTHMTETYVAAQADGGTSGHSVEVTNPPRSRRIETEVARVVDTAITDAIDRLQRLVELGDVTAEEITHSLRWHNEFDEAWQEHFNE